MVHVFFCNVLVDTTLVGGRAGAGGARAEPGASRGFSYFQWPSPPYLRHDQGPRGWSRSPDPVGILPGMMAVSTLVWSMARAWGLGAVLSAGFTFSHGMHILVGSCVGAGGVGTTPLSCPTLTQVNTGICSVEVVDSVPELVWLPSECAHQSMSRQWLLLPLRPGLGLCQLLSLQMCTVSLTKQYCLSGKQCWSKRDWSKSPVWAANWGGPGWPVRAPGNFQSVASALWIEVSKSMCMLFKSGGSVSYCPLVSPH